MVEKRDVPVMVNTIGTVMANATVAVKSQVDGQLLSAEFEEGQMVKAGDVLFRIDSRPIEASLRQAQGLLAQDQARLASAKSDADRAVQLAERGIVSAQQRDQLVAAAKALDAGASANQAAVDRARLQLGYTTIRAPMDGKTGPILVHPGNLVRANDAGALVVLTQIQPVKISFSLPQTHLPQLQDRMRDKNLIALVSVHHDDPAKALIAEDDTIQVAIDFIGNAVDNATGTIELRASFANPDLRLVPGELVDVGIRLDTLKDAAVVPRVAVNTGQSGFYVFVIDKEKKAEMRPAQVLYQDQAIAAIAGNFAPGEQVVTDGQLRLNPGTQVVIAEDQPAAVAEVATP